MGLDVLIIGSGGAGLSGALMAKESGAEVLVVSESYPTRAQTSMAQGGLNAVLPNSNDTIENHINDTIKASCGLGDKKMIELLCQDAPKTVEWLNSIGVPFSIDQDGNIAQRKLGGTKHERACYSQDYTGLK
ncbi:MAG TPA: FAD-binding protein, partial [Campylobacterales bacterium]|nr:FAD-binding protein [Campylobacterales bacterium]